MREFYEVHSMAFFLFCFVYYTKTFKNWDSFLNGVLDFVYLFKVLAKFNTQE